MIPIYVSFIPFFNNSVDQAYIWTRYIEPKIKDYGIVKIYFAGRWNYLINDPIYLNQLFKYELTLFHKSGNNEKIPGSLLAHYTGTNIISAHGKQWKAFRKILLPCFLNFQHYTIPFKNANKFCELISNNIHNTNVDSSLDVFTSNETAVTQNSKIENTPDTLASSYYTLKGFRISELVQKMCLDNISSIALGFNLNTLEDPNSHLFLYLNRIKKDIFKPIFMAFPFLDNFPIKSRTDTRKHIDLFKEELLDEVKKNLIDNFQYEQESYLNAGANLVKENSKGNISKDELLDNLVILLVAGHENPQLLLTSLIYVLGKYQKYQDILRFNFLKLSTSNPSDSDLLESLRKDFTLTSVIYETIRLYPPIGNLINRIAAKDCYLKGSNNQNVFIKKGTYIGYNNYGIQRRCDVWGKDANEFKPDRWGKDYNEVKDQWKSRKASAEIGAFHGGNRNCIGEELSLNIMRITVFKMITSFEWTLSNDWKERITPAGPICPYQLKIDIRKLYNKH
ncbi:hypothetical protein ACO0R3_000716 [Hanseniaspora guilliermondii]